LFFFSISSDSPPPTSISGSIHTLPTPSVRSSTGLLSRGWVGQIMRDTMYKRVSCVVIYCLQMATNDDDNDDSSPFKIFSILTCVVTVGALWAHRTVHVMAVQVHSLCLSAFHCHCPSVARLPRTPHTARALGFTSLSTTWIVPSDELRFRSPITISPHHIEHLYALRQSCYEPTTSKSICAG
jgi:hypothetical protein